MSTYYFLVNETKEEIVEYRALIKEGPIRYNEAVHMALVNYMLENSGDTLRFIGDNQAYYETACDYKEIDLKDYVFEESLVNKIIEDKYIHGGTNS